MGTVGERKDLGRRVVLFPCPLQGHINPMFQLAALLHTRGFSITILHTRLNFPETANHPRFHFVPIPDSLLDQPLPTGDVLALITALNANCEAPFRERMVRMLSETSEEAIACVIVDALMHSIQDSADQLGLQTLVLRTGSAASFNMFLAFRLLWEKGYLPVRDSSQLELPVTELPPLRVKDLPLFGGSSPEGLYQLLAQVVKGARASSGVIINTFTALEGTQMEKSQQQLSTPIFAVGPLHKFSPHTTSSLLAQDRSCMEWLDQQAPASVVYVSFGSLACMDGEEFVETAWGLADSHQPFLWVVRPGSVGGSEGVELPEGFEEETRGRGRVVKWAPQQEVLGHPAIGGFWTHSGWNSTIESIGEGVPMLCRPWFGDQMGNARYVSDVWKVGLRLEKRLERDQIQRAIRGLMAEGGNEMRDRARDLKQQAGYCIQEGGSSSKALDKLVEHLLSF